MSNKKAGFNFLAFGITLVAVAIAICIGTPGRITNSALSLMFSGSGFITLGLASLNARWLALPFGIITMLFGVLGIYTLVKTLLSLAA